MWHGIHGHDGVVEQFRRTLKSGRLASTYLFVGPAGIGKKRFALQLAKGLLCQRAGGEEFEACGECESCHLFAAGNHPDLHVVGLLPDKSELAISQFLGDKEHRHDAGLCHDISLKPFFGRRRIAIIDDADHFNASSANCLLKTLEEPPAHSLLILIGTSPSRQLPTIRSRSQMVRFSPLDSNTVATILLDNQLVTDAAEAARLAKLSEGSVEQAMRLADPALGEFRTLLLSQLKSAAPDGVRLTRAVQAFVDEAGKESAQKRDRLRAVIGFAVEHYRTHLPGREKPKIAGISVGVASSPRPEKSLEMAHSSNSLNLLDACLVALDQLDRNANIGLVVQNWCENLADFTARKAKLEA